MAWTPSQVVTVDGRTMMSDSPDWLRYCEALTVIKSPEHIGGRYRSMLERMRGKAGLEALEQQVNLIEPAYVLSLPDKPTRRAHLDKVQRTRGEVARLVLEDRVRALHAERMAAEVPA